ncbi:spore germination protein [Paenibacillus sp. MWE-103]|uniref:Spore germination protein n=1 Tax=Paenibacillus artemisiicola TaxID=1172618 RepID=A0ABS3W3U4_9BACL|nr:spore germination protein [Paenibacillus artemisiicola]MBO7742962.1 spore germination protein [Paenibacillus artemisiicola]
MSEFTSNGEPEPIGNRLADSLNRLKTENGCSSDMKFRELHLSLPGRKPVAAAVVSMDGLSDTQELIRSLLEFGRTAVPVEAVDSLAPADYLMQYVISDSHVWKLTCFEELYDHLFCGNGILLIEGEPGALSVSTQKINARGIEEPNVQSVVRGPREGFTEVLGWNMSMLRRKIRDRRLWAEPRKIGRVTQTNILVVYLNGIVSQELLEEVRRRLDKIDIDAILESNYIEESIQESQFSIFPTVSNSERPDVVAAQLLEGRVAILVDGTPFALVVPAVFTQMFQSPEDYYQRSVFSSLIRQLRLLSFLLAMFTPSLYIAITTYHQELLPTVLLYNLASQREGVPFPAFVEALIMEITFEILREASVRMPRTIGQSISIVGTLVIGQASVEAGLVTGAMVIVVSITAISNFVMPAFNIGIAIRIVRFLFMMIAASFGLFGLFLGMIVLVLRLCALQSFGVPYMSPLAPFNRPDQKETLWRVPIPFMKKRPSTVGKQNIIRQK